MGLQPRAAPKVDFAELYIESVARQASPQTLRPFDHNRAASQRLVEPELLDLIGARQPVEVEVRDARFAIVGLDQSESWRRRLFAGVCEGAHEAPRQSRFAGAEIAEQQDRVPLTESAGHGGSKRGGGELVRQIDGGRGGSEPQGGAHAKSASGSTQSTRST